MPENIIASIKLPSNDIYKIRDKEARHFLNIENVTTSSPVIVSGGGAMQNSKIPISISAAQLQAIADAWTRYPDDLAIEFRLYIISEGGETGSNPFCSWVVADKAVLTPVSLTTAQGVPLAGTYYVFTGTAETLDTLKSYPFTLKINVTNGSGVLDFTVGAAIDHTHGLINSDGTIDSSTVVPIPELTSDPTKAYSILVNDTANDGLLKPTAVAFGRDDRNAFLNKDGTWSSPSEGHFYVTGTDSTAAKITSPYNAAQWKGSNSDITALYTGLSINYTLDVTGDATYGTVLNINELGAHPVISHTGAPIGNTYAANAIIQLEYDATATADVYINSTEATTVTGCWKLALAQTPPYFVEGQNSIAAKTSKPYYAAIWNGSNPAIKALYSGLAISYKIDVVGNGTYGAVLDLNGWGEHPVVRNVNTAISNAYAVDSIINLIYDAEQSASVYLGSGAVSIKGCWKIADYDTNTQIVYRLLQNYSYPYVDSNSGALYRYEVCLTTPNNTIIPVSSISNKPAVYTKEFTSIPFDPFRPIYYYATTTTVEPGDSIGSALYDVYLIDARYSFNINSTGTPGVTALEANKMVYLRAKYNTLTHSATFDQNLESENYLERSSLVQDLPSTNPNTVAGNTLGPNEIYIYIFLGIASSEYAIDKAVTNFVYYWDPTTDNINVFSGIVPTNIDISTAVSVTYSELVSLKANNNLIPGANYRITDYVTKIKGTYDLNGAYFHFAKSAEHSYDVVVYAIDESTLAEDAKVTLHAGDTYFASANLEAWDIKYCLENDTDRFAWADTTNGKGVVYYLKDEWNNEAWYDFKNTLYLRYALQSLDSNFTDLAYNETYTIGRYGSAYTIYQIISGNTVFRGKYTLTAIENIQQALSSPEVDNNYLTTYNADWYYTFDYYNNNNQHYDLSLSQTGAVCHNNKFKWCADFRYALGGSFASKINTLGLPNTVFLNNTIGPDNLYWDNIFKENCWFNTFGDSAQSNTLGSLSFNNVFGNYSQNNIFGNYCNSNTFGNSYKFNIFGSNCNSNIFGSSCESNTFGDNCDSNIFGNNCSSNTFGDSCISNTFGNYCGSNIFGYDCDSNSLGNSCSSNTFGSSCDSNIFVGLIYYSTLENNIRYVNLVAPTNLGLSYTILDSVQGTSSSTPLVINMTPTYQSTAIKVPETYVGYKSDGTLRTWVLADTEDANNKVTTISSSSTDIQYPSAKAVYDELVDKEDTSNKVTSLSSSSTDTEYPSAKAVYDELATKEDVANKVTSLSASSTDTEYPSAKAVYDTTRPKLYTATVSGDLSNISRPITVSSFQEGSTSEVIADVTAGKYVIIRITDGQLNTYDFIYIGYTTAHTFRNTHNNSYIDLEFDSKNPPIAIIGQNVDTFEVVSNRVTSLSASSTHAEYPSAKTVYDAINSINISDKLKYITITPIGGAWDSSEGTYSCTISAADYTKINNAWGTDNFCVKTVVEFPVASQTSVPISFTLFKASTVTIENVEYYVFNAHYTGSTELDLEFADYDSFIFCISQAGAAGAAHSCLGFIHQGVTETNVSNIVDNKLTNYVNLTTDQSINGTKTFNSRPLSADTYTKIAYLQSDYNGTTITDYAYIKTGVRRGVDWTNKLTTELDGYFNVSQSLGFCGYDAGGQLGQVNGKWGVETTASSVDCIGVENRAVVKQVINLTTAKDTLYINDTQIAERATSSVSNYSTNFDYPIFVAATSGGYTYRPAALTLYRFKMYNDSDVLIRDFVPARTSSGQIGLLDTVNNVFYTKEGNGTFTAGADTSETVVISNPLLTAGDVAPVALSNDYNDLINKPTIPSTGRLNTNNSTALTPSSSESFSSTIALHKISKTGSYADLLNKPVTDSALNTTSTNAIQNAPVATALETKEDLSNKVTSISENSTDIEYPSAHTVYQQVFIGPYLELNISLGELVLLKFKNFNTYTNVADLLASDDFATAIRKVVHVTAGNNGTYITSAIFQCGLNASAQPEHFVFYFVEPIEFNGTKIKGIEGNIAYSASEGWGWDLDTLQPIPAVSETDVGPTIIYNTTDNQFNFVNFSSGIPTTYEELQALPDFLIACLKPILLMYIEPNAADWVVGEGSLIWQYGMGNPQGISILTADNLTFSGLTAYNGVTGDFAYDSENEKWYLNNFAWHTSNSLSALDYNATGLGIDKTITALTQTDGLISAAVSPINIDSTQAHRTASNDITIAASDALPVFDASDSNKLKGSLTFDGSTTTQFLSKKGSWETPVNTTYTFASGTNSFTVTPSGGQSQTVTVTPSITNNITGTGTAGALAKFSDAHTLVDGPVINSTDTTTFLRHDGTWVTPPATVVDSALDSTSTNPVQNKVVTEALNTKVDLTSNQTIDGEKTFLQRPVVSIAVDLPAEYTQLESIKGDGTAYINTGRKYSTDDKIYLSFKQSTTQNYRIWGTFGQSSYVGPNVSMTYSSGWMVRQETVANQSRGIGLPAIDTDRHSLWILSDGTVVFDGVDYSRSAGWAAGYTFNYNAYLFTINPGGATPTATLNGYIYQYRVWDAMGVLVQDMYPVARTSGGTTTYGMYDIIEGQFYGNVAGSGAFSAGSAMPMASTVVIESDLKPVAYSGSYTDLSNRPTIPTVGVLNTNNSDAQSVSSSESFGSTIKLHKVSKTGSFSDLLNKPSATISGLGTGKTITALSQTNGVISATATAIAITSTQVSSGTTATIASNDTLAIFDADDNKLKSSLAFNSTHSNQFLRKDGTWASTPTTTVGTLSISSTGQSIPSSAESFTGNITLHNVAKTGSFSDLLNKPSATVSGLATNKTLAALTQTNGTISATAADIAITSTQVTADSTAVAIATGDALIIADSSNSNKLAKTSITFNTSQQKSQNFLSENGTWVDVNTVIPAPMQFKGTVGGSHGTYTWANLPSASSENTGWTLKVLEAHTGIPTCKVGDTIISDGTMWVVIPSGDEPSGTVTSVALSEGSGITITGEPITTSGVITVAHGNTSNVADTTNTGRTYIQNIDFDEFGHVLSTTSATETVTIPANNVTGSGTSGYIAKFNGNNTITNGPALGSDTTTFLRNDGTWATPTDTNDKVKQLEIPAHPEPGAYGNSYRVLVSYEALSTEETNYVRKSQLTFDVTTKALSTGGGTVDGYDLNAASEKAVDTTIAASSTSTNLPTSQAVASFVEGKGYTTVDTTYKFADGTNGFTVTPVVNGTDGTGTFINVTPSIANNVTGTGTSGYIAKFNGDHSITNGPQFGSSTTTFLNNSGTWTTPPNTTYTFASGTNGFTVTPSGGTAQTVTITPSIPIDIVINETSTNAVQNKAIYEALPKVMRFI